MGCYVSLFSWDTLQHVNVTDNGAEFDRTFPHDMAAEECEKRDSFIKWHPDILCNATNFPQHWTSGTRRDETFVIIKACKIFSSS